VDLGNRVRSGASDVRVPSLMRVALGRNAVVLPDVRAVNLHGAQVTHGTAGGGAAVDAQAAKVPLVGAAPHEVGVDAVPFVAQVLENRHRARLAGRQCELRGVQPTNHVAAATRQKRIAGRNGTVKVVGVGVIEVHEVLVARF